MFSSLAGCALTGLYYLYCQIPRTGPSLLTLFISVPVQCVANLITKDRTFGEVCYYGLQILIFGVLSYSIMSFVEKLRSGNQKK